MRIGRLRHRVTLQYKVVVADSYGAETITWTDLVTVWGAVEPVRGEEFIELARAGAEISTRIVIRYRGSIVPEMRVVFGSHTYDVRSVIHVDERERELQLMCRELI